LLRDWRSGKERKVLVDSSERSKLNPFSLRTFDETRSDWPRNAERGQRSALYCRIASSFSGTFSEHVADIEVTNHPRLLLTNTRMVSRLAISRGDNPGVTCAQAARAIIRCQLRDSPSRVSLPRDGLGNEEYIFSCLWSFIVPVDTPLLEQSREEYPLSHSAR
jgi:hypothetical protein